MNNNQSASNDQPSKQSHSGSNEEDLEGTPTSHRYTLYAKIEEYQTLLTVKKDI